MLFFRKNQIFSVLFVLYFKNTLLCQKEKSSMRISSINISDNKAVIAALQNDELAEETFERFYKYYYKGLCAYAGRMVPLAIAEEIVQTAMMWIWENRATLITKLSVKSLLFTIVRNKALHNAAHLKLRERVHHAILTKTESKYDDPDYYMGEELAELFSAALSRLPERYRKSFEMSRIEGENPHADCGGIGDFATNSQFPYQRSHETASKGFERLSASAVIHHGLKIMESDIE